MKYYLFVITIIFINACSTNPQPNIKEKNPTKIQKIQPKNKKITSTQLKPIKSIKIQKSYLPQWIMQTNPKKGYMCNIGSSALSDNMAISKKVAIIQAKANISQDIQSYVKTQSKLQEKCVNDECKSKFTSSINISSTQMIRNIEITNHFIDTKKGIYYVQVCSKL